MLEQDDNIGGQSDDKQLNKSVSSMFLSLPDFSVRQWDEHSQKVCKAVSFYPCQLGVSCTHCKHQTLQCNVVLFDLRGAVRDSEETAQVDPVPSLG